MDGASDGTPVGQTLRQNQQNDAADAETIGEAVGRPNMRFVPIKNVEQ
jgi:transposase